MIERITASYEIESPDGLAHAADVLAGEQSTGTFVRLASETNELRERSAARVEHIEVTGSSKRPSLPCRRTGSNYERGVVTLSWPLITMGPSLPNILATVAGNLFELAELSAIRLLDLGIPRELHDACPGSAFGIQGTRDLMGVPAGPMIGTIVKPSVGLDPEETARLVSLLAEADIDFIKDDELQADGPACPFDRRASLVMDVLNNRAERTGKKIMYAFNITGEIDEMARRLDKLDTLGGTCAMVSLHSLGLVGLRWLRDRSPLPIHGHRNGWGLLSRSPHIGIAFPAMQKLWRLAGVDHLHVNGLNNKFTESDKTVIEAARAVQAPIREGARDSALPVFSSGQTAWQIGPSAQALGNEDFLFCAGGGIMGHPDGPGAGVLALRLAAEAFRLGITPQDHALSHPVLAKALDRH